MTLTFNRNENPLSGPELAAELDELETNISRLRAAAFKAPGVPEELHGFLYDLERRFLAADFNEYRSRARG